MVEVRSSQLLLLLLLLLVEVVVVVVVVVVVAAVGAGHRSPQRQAPVLLQQPHRGVGPAGPGQVRRGPLHLVHGLGDGGQGGGGRVSVQAGRRAEEGGVVEPVVGLGD